MKTKLFTLAAAGLLSLSMSMTSLAGTWKQDQTGWWYQNDDSSYLSNGWNWIDGRCYYFTPSGYCLQNTTTPDGYTVDLSGAWTVDGIIQAQNISSGTADTSATNVIVEGSITLTVPDGFTGYDSGTAGSYFINAAGPSIIGILSENIPDLDGYEGIVDAFQEYILDEAIKQNFGSVGEKQVVPLSNGTWYSYYYADSTSIGIPGSAKIYTKIVNGSVLQTIIFGGNLSVLDMDSIISNNIR